MHSVNDDNHIYAAVQSHIIAIIGKLGRMRESCITYIPYSGKVWWGESLANLANHP